MGFITANEAMLAQLRRVVESVEILDADGTVLGHYTPAKLADEDELYRQAAALFDPDEIKRIAASDEPCYTFEQVMEHLRSLEKPK
jgi:hypothetical protein